MQRFLPRQNQIYRSVLLTRQIMTHQQWQLAARARLERAHHEEAHATARLLLDWATATPRAALINPGFILDETTLAKLAGALQKLEMRVPLAHITRRAHFYGLELEVSPATLIPRPETEFLVETVLHRLPPNARVADLGTGSGAIAVVIKSARPDCLVWATEVSPDALEIARCNAARLQTPITFLAGASDWLSPLQDLASLDAIVSNPPYIPAADIEILQSEVRLYEPRAALDGGADGLDPYRIFAKNAGKLLKEGGFCAVELGDDQWDEVRALFVASGWHVEAAVYDLQNIRRVLVALHA